MQTSFSVALNRKYHQETWKFYYSRKKLTKGSTHLDRDGTHRSSALENVFCQLLQLFDSPFGCFALINFTLFFESNISTVENQLNDQKVQEK